MQSKNNKDYNNTKPSSIHNNTEYSATIKGSFKSNNMLQIYYSQILFSSKINTMDKVNI